MHFAGPVLCNQNREDRRTAKTGTETVDARLFFYHICEEVIPGREQTLTCGKALADTQGLKLANQLLDGFLDLFLLLRLQ